MKRLKVIEDNQSQEHIKFVNYNANGKSKFTVNSGFVEESNNEAFKQLILSERVWIYDGNFMPLNVSKKVFRI